ncbi:hypothetical protein NOK12_12210 [Nocardioides sp. OK12]|uniref:hypothetical protein n=1 Tax=Nocardioides sp. OK12 TaxID=2758661 RepID=UPI0021C28CE1|nr:hypothetical protein [Nocardioides sp. OK12]GHJ58703.1 hypothetical protein NOK12_12210 [Nocardioides sp. OK12]
MRAGGELRPPAAYDDQWLWWAVAALAAVAVYYVLVLWATRTRLERSQPTAGHRPDDVSSRLDRIAAAVGNGSITPREGHQQISEAVRAHVAAVSDLPARSMTLADLQQAAPGPLADLVELVYPPAFAPGKATARERFDIALQRAREVVATW